MPRPSAMTKELVTVSANAHLIATNAMSKTSLLIRITVFYHKSKVFFITAFQRLNICG